jgi:kremen protein
MKSSLVLLSLSAGATLACDLPATPPPNTITTPFRVQVQNASHPEVHNKFMNLLPSGGGDQHLFIGPVGDPTFDLTLIDGVITHVGTPTVRAVIGGEVCSMNGLVNGTNTNLAAVLRY